jgi:DNA polymerase-3 subunit beta
LKLKVDKTILDNALSIASQFFGKKDSDHLGVYLGLSNSLQIIATDDELGIRIDVKNIESVENGFATVNGKKLLDIIKGLKKDTIELEAKNDILEIKQKNTIFKMKIMDSEENEGFFIGDSTVITIDDTDEFRKVITTVATVNNKFELTGALIDIKENENLVNIVGTDTKRLTIVKANYINGTGSYIIPKKTLIAIQKLFSGKIDIQINEFGLIIEKDEFMFFSKIIIGSFPKYERIIPTSINHTISVNKDDFLKATKTIASLSEVMKITFNSNKILFECVDNASGNASTDIETEHSITDFYINMNTKYILDFIKIVKDDSFTIMLSQSDKPFILKAENFITIAMPVNN